MAYCEVTGEERSFLPLPSASLAMTRITFETTPFELSHGRSPRGRGSWAFCPFHLRNANDYIDHTLFSPSMTYAEAKRWMKAHPQAAAAELWAVMP